MESVIVLNADLSYLSETSWQSAVTLLWEGKAEIWEATTKVARNASRTVEIVVPTAIRMFKYVKNAYKKSENTPSYAKHKAFIRDKFTCAYCGEVMKSATDCTIDHIVPKAQGGQSSWKNCITSCKPCNNRKANRTPKEAGMKLRYKARVPTNREFAEHHKNRKKVERLQSLWTEKV